MHIVIWIRAGTEIRQDLKGTVDRILLNIQTQYFTKSFEDGSMVQLKTASSCQDLKCENKTETVVAKIPPTTTTTTAVPCFNCIRSSSKTLLNVDMTLIVLGFLVAFVSANIFQYQLN